MIIGIGTDIIRIDRVSKTITNNKFMEKIYTKNEIKLIKIKGLNTCAGNFAAKEAIVKAMGTGFVGFWPIDIEVLRDDLGMPIVNFYGKALEICKIRNINQVHVSISHCKEYAVAYAIALS